MASQKRSGTAWSESKRRASGWSRWTARVRPDVAEALEAAMVDGGFLTRESLLRALLYARTKVPRLGD